MNKPYRLPADYMKWSKFLDHSEKMSLVFPQRPNDLAGLTNPAKGLAYLYEEWSKGYPVYCVRRSLINEMLETDVGENVALFKNIYLSLPTYLLCFPKSTIKSPIENGFVDYLIVNIVEQSIKEGEDEYKYIVFWGCFDSNNVLLLSGKGIRWDGTTRQSQFVCSKMEIDASMLIRNIVLQSILLLQYYPKVQQEMTSVAPTKQSKGFGADTKPLDCRLPRWLGNEKSEYNYSESKTERKNEEAKKSKHYRASHWRLQPCGEGRKDIKPVRVTGTWVNPDL